MEISLEQYNKIAERLTELEYLLAERQWIPVSERLPKNERKEYWVCTNTEAQCVCRWTNNVYGLGESDKWGWSVFDTPQYTKVVAWQPLPEPYREVKE